MTTYCFFHSQDWDGYASAAVIKKFSPDAHIIPFNYNDEFPFDTLNANDIVFFVDVVIQPYEKMIELYDICKNLIIIDHHKSFLESEVGKLLRDKQVLWDSSTVYASFTPVNNAEYAACELTWIYMSRGEKRIPKVISLLGQYDAWRNTPDKMFPSDIDWETVLAFQFGIRTDSLNTAIVDSLIHLEECSQESGEEYLAKPLDQIIRNGLIILTYQNNQNEILMKHSFDACISGMPYWMPSIYKYLCVNTHLRNSDVFKSKWNKEKYDVMVAFSFGADGRWQYSFYTDKEGVDVSKIASIFGGGGHQKAAGCYSKNLILERVDNV